MQACVQQVPTSDVAAAGPAAVCDIGRLSYLVDPLHHMSAALERPGYYAAPLLPGFRCGAAVARRDLQSQRKQQAGYTDMRTFVHRLKQRVLGW